MKLDFTVSRYCKFLSDFRPRSGDHLRVGEIDLGEFHDLVDWEYQRAKTTFHMRPMWFTGSPYGREILRIAEIVRAT